MASTESASTSSSASSTSTTTTTTTTETNNVTSTTLSTKQLQRQAFNWVFLNTDTEVTVFSNVRDWSVDEVSRWLEDSDLSGLVDVFAKEDVDGSTLLDLSENDLKDLGLSLGNRKKVEKARSAVLQRLAGNTSKKNGVILPKGCSPSGRPLSEQVLSRIKNQKYNPVTKAYEPRKTPLIREELECWHEQAAWLVCPISGKQWLDEDSILGVGLYHAPRLMSDKEVQRALDDEVRATVEKQQKREKEAEEKKKLGKDADDFAKDFQHFENGIDLDTAKTPDFHKPLGIVDVIVGPTFDARAYNWGRNGNPVKGIQSKKERGVLSMDQQYNAFNFVLRAKDSYERKLCTNRLSFFIDEFHGSRVFPENIESQLSLLVYRDKRLCKDSNNTRSDEKHRLAELGDAIRKVIPRVLRAVIMEVANGRSSALEERIDYSIRTYLLIHQISIKLVLYYKQAYESLYRSIVLWIQNPFAELCEFNWPNLEDVLIGASLVGIPWAIMRESFVKKLVYVAVSSAPNMKGSISSVLEYLFEHNKQLFHLILYEFSFLFTSNRSLVQMDDAYSRCAGSLPRAEREAMKERLKTVEQVSTFMEVWATLGMDVTPDEDEQLEKIDRYFKYISTNVATWKKQPLPESKISIPDPSQEVVSGTVINQGIVLRSDLERQKEQALALERAKHRGYPPLTPNGVLSRNVCLYPLCQKKFKCRDHLFRHLRKVIEPERMITGYHTTHQNLSVAKSNHSLECGACHEVFTTRDEINAHYAARGVRGYDRSEVSNPAAPSNSQFDALVQANIEEDNKNKNTKKNKNNKNNNNKAESKGKAPAAVKAEEKDPDAVDMGTCVICMDKKREAYFDQIEHMPCGHLICCYDCSLLVKECAMCRVPIRDVIRVYCS